MFYLVRLLYVWSLRSLVKFFIVFDIIVNLGWEIVNYYNYNDGDDDWGIIKKDGMCY